MRVLVAAMSLWLAAVVANAEVKKDLPAGVFEIKQSIRLPGTPDEIFGAITGDISGWWDHSFSEHPKKLYLEPTVGGCFCEIFDEKGNGVQHAVVTYVDRPKILRFKGPLGLAGNAVDMVCTYTFEALGTDSTQLNLHVQVAGHVEPAWPDVVGKVWSHFLVERFQPYVEAGKHKAKR